MELPKMLGTCLSVDAHPCCSLLSLRTFRPHSRAGVRQNKMCLYTANEASAPVLHEDILEVLFTEADIQARIADMGRDLAGDYQQKQPLIIGTLNGAFVFMADLVRAMHPVPDGMQLDFLRTSSYVGASTIGEEAISMGLVAKIPATDRHIIVVEDIVDTGKTLQEVCARLRAQGAASIATVTLLDKAARRTVDLQPDYTGFECPNEFVVGYGLDFNEHYRSLPYVGVLKPECYI